MRNNSIDGLRGQASLIVMITHFSMAFTPGILDMNYPMLFKRVAHPSFLQEVARFPLVSIFYNGNFAVLIFFVISGFVLSKPYYEGDIERIKRLIWGRYLRLNIPIAISVIISFILFKTGLYKNLDAALLSGSVNWLSQIYPPIISSSDLVHIALYKTIFFGDFSLNPALWSLGIEFIGSICLLLFCLCMPSSYKIFSILTIGVIFWIIYKEFSIYFIAMLSGLFIHHLKIKSKHYLLIIFIFGIYFGLYQGGRVYYDILPNLDGILATDPITYTALGAFLLTLSVANGFGANFFAQKFFIWLGSISYSLYLLHILILSTAGCWLYLSLQPGIYSLTLIFVIYILMSILTSYLYTLTVDRFSIKISHHFANILCGNLTRTL